MVPKPAVTLESIKELLKTQKQEIVQEISTSLNLELTNIKERITTNENAHNSNTTEIKQLKEKVKTLEDKLDDQKNRSLRNTLIVRGIKESDTEKNWNQTTQIISDILGYHLNIQQRDVINMIERCHRGNKKEDKIRPIFIKFHSGKMLNLS